MDDSYLIKLIREDMRPALGCTEPGIIALASAKAAECAAGKIRSVNVYVNAGIYKNAYTCRIPGTDVTGNQYAAALGALCGDARRHLTALSSITSKDVEKAAALIKEDKVHVTMTDIRSSLYVNAVVEGEEGTGEARIEGDHTFFTFIRKDSKILHRADYKSSEKNADSLMGIKFSEFRRFADSVEYGKIRFIEEAVNTNRRLVQKGREWDRCTITQSLIKQKQDRTVIDTCAAIEARFLGAGEPAMSITGSGAHGLMCTVPLICEAKKYRIDSERLIRAIVLSFLITMYVKECSGKLSAFCGCGIAGGLGVAYALPYLMGEDVRVSEFAFNNMTSSITGMLCTGGNQACALRGVAAVQAALTSVLIAREGVSVKAPTGILGESVEKTAENVGLIADPGMIKTDEVILSILREKDRGLQDYII